ncbi:hypothetical protein CRP01_36310 [Flavilitoribacter nigricans DSM 23189 = NBRC 102662]|uniref:LamG-like jellyroll fold domain-containing protein n=1 Tax=Flavilitoribacter nigricans (strain ATCC 23147 / DSM 23189 / NBRC 102662 / NCIMB 1420 / SS-2) TaxID=1122177 RepID=A0A2D0MZB7_FLAN2|nr:hypothetical protein CRP01_36310 [Flavilitoribacter nigricans DSM 23189 = NBRC 102662]
MGGAQSIVVNIPLKREEFGTEVQWEIQVWENDCFGGLQYVTGFNSKAYVPFYEEFSGNTSITASSNLPEQACGFRVASWDKVPTSSEVKSYLYDSPATSFALPKSNDEYTFSFDTGDRTFSKIRYYTGAVGAPEGSVQTKNNPGSRFDFSYRPNTVFLKAAANYTRLLILECYNSSNNIAQLVAIPVIVTGTQTAFAKDAEGNFLTTESAPIPNMVLHKAPGDESFSYISESTNTCSQVNFGFSEGNNQSGDVKVTVGSDVSVFGVNIESEFSVTGSFSRNATKAGESATEVCRTITKTVENQNSFNGEEGDLFIGNSTIFRYGPALEVRYNNCKVQLRNKALNFLAVDMKDFAYLKTDIENDVIPAIVNLQSGLNPNSVEWKELERNRKAWQDMIEQNHQHQADAPALSGIVTLNGDRAGIGAEVSVERSETYSTSSSLILDASILVEAGISVGGSGVSTSLEVGITTEVSRGSSSSQTSVQTFGYQLKDNDPDDKLLIKVKRDQRFGTHIFELQAESRTSCPYEGGRQLNQPKLFALDQGVEKKEINIYAAAGTAAQIPIRIRNGSSITEVTTAYRLEGGNLADADVELGAEGIGLDNQTKEYNLAGNAFIDLVEGSGQDLLYVKQNANSPNQLTYEGIEILLTPSCEEELSDIFDRITLNVYFENPPAVSPANRTVDGMAGMTSFQVNTNSNWTASSEADWLSIDSGSGNGNGSFTVTYTENPEFFSRTAMLQIQTTGGALTTVQLIQEAICESSTGSDTDSDGIPDGCDNCTEVGSIGMAFDGKDDYLQLENLDNFNPAKNTIEMWIYLESLPTTTRSWPLFLGEWNSGQHWIINSDGTTAIGPFGGPQHHPELPLGEWMHLATVYDGSNFILYINGVRYGSRSVGFAYPVPLLVIGRPRGNDEYFHGRMDDIRIWNTARTEEQIAEAMNRELMGTEPGLLAYYNLGEGLPALNNTCVSEIRNKTTALADLSLHNFSQTGTTSNWISGAPIRLRNSQENDEGNACRYSPGVNFQALPVDTLRVGEDVATLELPVITPDEGAYSSPFVTDRTFDVNQAGPGTYEVVYTVPTVGSDCTISDALTVVVETVTATVDEEFLANLDVWPNPVKDRIRIRLDGIGSGPLRIQLWSSGGQLLQNELLPNVFSSGMEHELSVSDLPDGLYLLTFESAAGRYKGSRKIVKH